MKVAYLLKIDHPETHIAHITMELTELDDANSIELFLPSWSPGSYFMREYAAFIKKLMVRDQAGRVQPFEQIAKGSWKVEWEGQETAPQELTITYDVYCHELSPRHSHIDIDHAFLHGPTLFMGVQREELEHPTLALEFPALWSKVSTGLKDISPRRDAFLYQAKNYEELVDCPIEIGCHETDGFRIKGIDHELAYRGMHPASLTQLKEVVEKITNKVVEDFGDIPFPKYTFLNSFIPKHYGGLEHSNSSAILFDGQKLVTANGVQEWGCLIAHEYFHAWNGKRIRPPEFASIDYTRENYTRMLWLVEGLTSFMDELYLLRTKLCTLEEYLAKVTKQIQQLELTPGRKFDSLEDASFNAWTKLYRPHENNLNSTVSYYLKGGLTFFVLNSWFFFQGISFIEFLRELWASHKKAPYPGIRTDEVLKIIESLVGTKVRDDFETMITTTEELELELALQRIGLKGGYERTPGVYWGIRRESKGERVLVKNVYQDGPAYKSGLNVGDELLGLNGQRITRSNFAALTAGLRENEAYQLQVARQAQIHELSLILEKCPRQLQNIAIIDRDRCLQALLV